MITETVYLDHDNTIDLLLKSDSSGSLAAEDLSAVTRMVLEIGTDSDPDAVATVDSDVDADVFDWTTGTTGKVIIGLGDQSLTAGTYFARLIVYDAEYTDGLVWGVFRLVVKE
jgi:succinylglutamate desuccinylase